jgi:hypothetical protein
MKKLSSWSEFKLDWIWHIWYSLFEMRIEIFKTWKLKISFFHNLFYIKLNLFPCFKLTLTLINLLGKTFAPKHIIEGITITILLFVHIVENHKIILNKTIIKIIYFIKEFQKIK